MLHEEEKIRPFVSWAPPPLLVVHDNINLNAKSKGLTQENEQGVAVLHKRKNLVFQEEEWLERKAGLSLV